MLDCLIKDNRFKLDQYAFFEDVHLMTVNLQRMTPGILKQIKNFISELTELCNWSDVHIGIGCYKKPNQRSGEMECFAVVGLFIRDFQRFLVAQFYQRRQLRQTALGISDFSK